MGKHLLNSLLNDAKHDAESMVAFWLVSNYLTDDDGDGGGGGGGGLTSMIRPKRFSFGPNTPPFNRDSVCGDTKK